MGELSRKFETLYEAIKLEKGDGESWRILDDAQQAYNATIRKYAATDLDEQYGVVRASLEDAPDSDAKTLGLVILRWCEDINARVLSDDE